MLICAEASLPSSCNLALSLRSSLGLGLSLLPGLALPKSGSSDAPWQGHPTVSLEQPPPGSPEKQPGCSDPCTSTLVGATTFGISPLSFLPHMLSPGQYPFPGSQSPTG